jgi:hypothetical protein
MSFDWIRVTKKKKLKMQFTRNSKNNQTPPEIYANSAISLSIKQICVFFRKRLTAIT